MCLDNPEDLSIWGSIQSGLRSNIYVSVTKCHAWFDENCKPAEEIEDALQGATFEILYKQVKFDHTKYGEQSI